MQHLPTYNKWILFFAVLLVAFGIATPVLADWLGPPNRQATTTTSVCHSVLYECKEVNQRWKYKRVEDWNCSSESKPCRDYPETSVDCNYNNRTYQYCSSDVSLLTITTPLDPATIAGSISCTVQNGWCRSGIAPELVLHAQEPLPEHRILLIEGTLNGMVFACQSGALDCSVPLSEGNNDLAYWALSSWGDSTDKGTAIASVDTVSPNVGLDINGAGGTNGWYISPTTITATGSDATSGVASALLSTNPLANPIQWQPSATLGEGVYNIAVEVADYAGNISDSSTTLSVDTTTPSINVSVGGTAGNNGWYNSIIQVSALASDATSGIATLEVSTDGAAYQSYTPAATIPLNDGHHTIRFKAIDRAGNRTETPVQEFSVDTIAPAVDLPRSWQLGRNVPYSVQDSGSGLAAVRIVIEDEDERYAKVAWNEMVSGANYSQDINWNGQFKDKTVAPPGIYLVWIKASDNAGNEHFELGKVIVPEPNGLFNLLPTEEPAVAAAPPAPPAELSETDGVPPVTAPPAQDFGGGTTEPGEVTTHSFLLTSGTAGGLPASTSSSGVLWGAAAAAVIAAATAYALESARQRRQTEAEQAAQVAGEIASDKERHAERLQKQQENWARQQALEQQQYDYPIQIDRKVMRMEEEEGAETVSDSSGRSTNITANEDQRADRKDALIDEQFKAFSAEPQDWQTAYDAYMAQRALKNSQQIHEQPSSEPSWWDKVWAGADQHQTEIALGIGIAVGVLAIILSGGLAAPLVAAAWVAGAAVAAAGIVTLGTVALNVHYGREWHENLVQNIAISGLSAAAVTGAWFLFQAATTAIAPFCATHTEICGRVEPVLNTLDWGEETWLVAKQTFQTWTGDEAGAADTALELQMEHMDGGMPGNSVAKELGGKFGEEAIEEIANYGDEALSLVMQYGDDAAQIITKYGDDGIAVLMKYGDDAIDLINKHGPLATKVLQAVDPAYAEELLEVVDDDVIEYVVQQGPDAVDALSRWNKEDLIKYGPELALRAKRDGEVLTAVKKLASLGPINPKNLTEEQRALINEIAEKSTQYNDNGQAVLGRWVDQGDGFVEVAKDTGSVHYNPHPDMWERLGELGTENQSEVAWLINQQVVQTGIDKGLPFEYTLNGIPTKDIIKETNAVQAIFAGATDAEVMKALKSTYMPIRMKELQELQKTGYELTFDETTNSYFLIRP